MIKFYTIPISSKIKDSIKCDKSIIDNLESIIMYPDLARESVLHKGKDIQMQILEDMHKFQELDYFNNQLEYMSQNGYDKKQLLEYFDNK